MVSFTCKKIGLKEKLVALRVEMEFRWLLPHLPSYLFIVKAVWREKGKWLVLVVYPLPYYSDGKLRIRPGPSLIVYDEKKDMIVKAKRLTNEEYIRYIIIMNLREKKALKRKKNRKARKRL